MKKTFTLLALFIGILVSAQSTWKSDPSHSKISFSITHLMISEVTGHFSDFSIEATANDDFSNPIFDVEIKTASINTDNSRRDDHLKSDDFFGVEEFPSIVFKTVSVEKTGDKTFKLVGDITIKGVTKSITFEGKVNGVITDRRSNKLRSGLKLTSFINRLDFNIGGERVSLGDEIGITINLEMTQQ